MRKNSVPSGCVRAIYNHSFHYETPCKTLKRLWVFCRKTFLDICSLSQIFFSTYIFFQKEIIIKLNIYYHNDGWLFLNSGTKPWECTSKCYMNYRLINLILPKYKLPPFQFRLYLIYKHDILTVNKENELM